MAEKLHTNPDSVIAKRIRARVRSRRANPITKHGAPHPKAQERLAIRLADYAKTMSQNKIMSGYNKPGSMKVYA